MVLKFRLVISLATNLSTTTDSRSLAMVNNRDTVLILLLNNNSNLIRNKWVVVAGKAKALRPNNNNREAGKVAHLLNRVVGNSKVPHLSNKVGNKVLLLNNKVDGILRKRRQNNCPTFFFFLSKMYNKVPSLPLSSIIYFVILFFHTSTTLFEDLLCFTIVTLFPSCVGLPVFLAIENHVL